MEVQLGFQEKSVVTNHQFIDGICKFCGDTEVNAKAKLEAYIKENGG